MANQQPPQAVDPSNPNSVPKFVDPVPIPPILQTVVGADGQPVYQLRMLQVQQQLHRNFPPTTVWGYEGMWPGPTIEARRNQTTVVRYFNQLPATHLLPTDTSIHGAEPFRPAVRTVVHLHDGNTPAVSDGNPDAWFSPGFAEVGPFFTTNQFVYPNDQPATTLWYHDHTLGITRLNIYAGLAGFYLLRSNEEEQLRLPSGPFEIPLMLQDRSFNANGSLSYPATWVPEFFGNTNLVNGKVWPFLPVEPRKYRFRLLNAANGRFYNLGLEPPLTMFQIGVDGGLLERPVPRGEIMLAPSERADVVIDFSGRQGNSFTLRNNAPAAFPTGTAPDANTGVVMQFRVVLPLSSPDTSQLPDRLATIPVLRPEAAVRTRDLTLNQRRDHAGRQVLLLGTRDLSGRPEPLTWGDAVTERPVLNTIEIWRLLNTTTDTHPIHVHLIRFQILDRQPFDVARLRTTGELVFTGPPLPPSDNERGWKDTVRAAPAQVTRFIARFGDYAGSYVWHCHILEHEDNDMMRRFEVIRPG